MTLLSADDRLNFSDILAANLQVSCVWYFNARNRYQLPVNEVLQMDVIIDSYESVAW